jgi:hypothetical protein
MEPPRLLDEQAALGRHGRVRRRAGVPGEQMSERAALRARRVAPLEGLVQLLGIAEEHERARGGRHRDRRRKAHLARLVDEEDIDAAGHGGIGPEPGSAADHVERAGRQRGGDLPRLAERLGRGTRGLLVRGRLLSEDDGRAARGRGPGLAHRLRPRRRACCR